MSFKRAGDDHCALRLQKKHRVTELLSEDIPSDEASKTRSGRFVCVVCPHHPVLDTMAMLTIHRQGKKHLAHVAVKVEKEHNLTELMQKREQERHLNEAMLCTASPRQYPTAISNTITEAQPLLQQTREVTEVITKQRKNYSSKKHSEIVKKNFTSLKSSKKHQPFFQSRVKILLPGKLEHERSTSSQEIANKPVVDVIGTARKSAVAKETCVTKETSVGVGRGVTTNAVPVAEGKTTTISKGVGFGYGKVGKRKEPSKEQQRYLELKMSGWIVDHTSGNWVKDENVEFDSDEDDPPSVC